MPSQKYVGSVDIPSGPSVVQFVPPLVVKEEEVDDALSRFEKAIAKRVTKAADP